MKKNKSELSETPSTVQSDMSSAAEKAIVDRAYELITQLQNEGLSPYTVVCIIATAATVMLGSQNADPQRACKEFCEAVTANVKDAIARRVAMTKVRLSSGN